MANKSISTMFWNLYGSAATLCPQSYRDFLTGNRTISQVIKVSIDPTTTPDMRDGAKKTLDELNQIILRFYLDVILKFNSQPQPQTENHYCTLMQKAFTKNEQLNPWLIQALPCYNLKHGGPLSVFHLYQIKGTPKDWQPFFLDYALTRYEPEAIALRMAQLTIKKNYEAANKLYEDAVAPNKMETNSPNSKLLLAQIHLYGGMCCFELEKYDEAIACYEENLRIPSANKDEIYIRLVNACLENNESQKAYSYAKKITNPKEQRHFKALAAGEYGKSLSNADKLKEAKKYLNEAYDFSKEKKEHKIRAIHASYLGHLYLKSKEFPTAVKYLEEANEQICTFEVLNNLGIAYISSQKYGEAVSALEEASKKTNNEKDHNKTQYLIDLLRIFIHLQSYSITNLKESKGIYTDIEDELLANDVKEEDEIFADDVKEIAPSLKAVTEPTKTTEPSLLWSAKPKKILTNAELQARETKRRTELRERRDYKEKLQTATTRKITQAVSIDPTPPKFVTAGTYEMAQKIFRVATTTESYIIIKEYRNFLENLGGRITFEQNVWKAELPHKNTKEPQHASLHNKHETGGDNELLWFSRSSDRKFIRELLEKAGYVNIYDFRINIADAA